MPSEIYAKHGIQFEYPREWEVNEQQRPGELSITVSSPETAFWNLILFCDRPDPELILETVIETFEDEYDELDVYRVQSKVCGQEALSRDIEFVCLELLNTARIRIFQTDAATVLVLCQANDSELEFSDPLFNRIAESLEIDDLTLIADGCDEEFDTSYLGFDAAFIGDPPDDDDDESGAETLLADEDQPDHGHDHGHDCGHDHDHDHDHRRDQTEGPGPRAV